MSESYSKLYYSKKNQLSNSNSTLSDVRQEIGRVSRTSSPQPISRTDTKECIEEKKECPKRKVMYMDKLEEVRSVLKVEVDEKNLKVLGMVEESVKNALESVEKKLNENKTFLESVKSDNLKVALNEVIEQVNSNSKAVAEQLKNLSTQLEDLKGEINEIKEVL